MEIETMKSAETGEAGKRKRKGKQVNHAYIKISDFSTWHVSISIFGCKIVYQLRIRYF